MTSERWSSGSLTTILEVFDQALAKRGANFDFIDYSGETFSLGFLQSRSTELAHGLAQAGAKYGECVASLLNNCVEQLLLLLACSKIGAIHVPLNTAYKGEYLRHQLSDSAAAVVIMDSEYVERLFQIEEGLPDVKTVFVKGEMPAQHALRMEVAGLESGFLKAATPLPFVPSPSDLAMLIYTAGTTGPSKGCMISQNYLCNMARQLKDVQLYNEDDVIWTPLPGFHLNQYTATIVSALLVGARAAIFPRFSVSRFWPEIERTGATVTQILSSMVRLIAEAPDNEAATRYYGKLRVAAGAPFPEDLQQKWRDRFAPKFVRGPAGYGLTECAILTSVSIEEDRPSNASGHRNDDFDVIIVDDQDKQLPAGEAGEILVRPKHPHVMFEGYWRRPAETLKIMRNMWFHTGDIGSFDKDGWFYFLDRKKDYLRRRGENISSMEMESVFSGHPAIAEVAVHAVLADLEDDVKVTCTLVDGARITEEELCRWSVDNLPYFAVPRFIEFRTELPKNPVGRVLKYELRDQGITVATWDRDKSTLELVKR